MSAHAASPLATHRTDEQGRDHVSPGEIAIGVIIGRTSEYFDFFVFGLGCVLVFPQLVFPMEDRLTGTLYSFAIFALAFITRPLGSVLFMEVDRRYDRATKLTIALFLLAGSTAAIAFLPGYETIGAWSAVVLAVFRLLQGFALGGAWDGMSSLLALNAPPERRGWYAMLPQLGAPIGFILAAGLFAFFEGALSQQDFIGWGWRYPFFVALTINVVALFARLRMVTTHEFAELMATRELTPTPVFELLAKRGSTLLLGAFVPLASFALFHLVTIFPVSWINLFTNRSVSEFMIVQMAGGVICAGAIMTSGLIADQIGRRKQLIFSAALVGLFSVSSIVAPLLFGDSLAGQTVFVIIGFGLLGLSYGQTSGAVASSFGAQYRYTGAALTHDLAWLIGAGFAPLVALTISSDFGLAWVGVYLLSGAICTMAALWLDRRLEARYG
ncbi:MFS transporter [Bosea sp. (in: a-proteobacteria)]|uniref:MFS transporter n=1 Tax=Bosea sp. (in: a-proteobacteria) TaxID=1871050 RepID=UPI003B3A886B